MSFVVGAITYKISTQTRGIIDNSMAGLANNFAIACPHCKETDWYPASGEKPKELKAKRKSKEKSESAIV